MAKVPNFSAGDPVTVNVSERGLLVKPVNRCRETLIYTESELLADLTPETAQFDQHVPEYIVSPMGLNTSVSVVSIGVLHPPFRWVFTDEHDI